MKINFLALIFLYFFHFVSFSQTGEVNPLFNIQDNGVYPTNVDFPVREAHIYPNGKYLVGGDFTTLNGQVANRLVRTTNDGVIDSSFNAGGSGPNGNIRGFLVLSNQKILIFGYFTSYNGVAVDSIALLHENGTIDTTFLLANSPLGEIKSVTEQSNGSLVIGGQNSINQNQGNIVRILQNGQIDNSFTIGTPITGFVNKIYCDNYNNIYAVGDFSQVNSHVTKCIARFSPNGGIDTGFSVPANYGAGTKSIVVNSDSTIVTCGSYTTPNNIFGMYGYFKTLPNGQIDPSFQSAPGWSHFYAIAKDSLDRYYFNMDNNQQKTIVRVLSNGVVDTLFNQFTHAVAGVSGIVNVIKIEATGRILLAGQELSRRNTDGTKDETFLSPNGANGSVMVVKTLSDGKSLIGGAFSGYNNISRNGIARLLPDGSLDLSFDPGSGAVSGVSTSDFKWKVNDIEVQNDGKILVCGGFPRFNNKKSTGLIRLHPNGSIDTSFNINKGFNNTVHDIVIQPDGKIIVCGEFTKYGFNSPVETSCGRIIRLNTDGSIDNTFQLQGAANGKVLSMKLLSNGKLIIGGTFMGYNGVAINNICRVNPNGTIDNTFTIGTGPAGEVSEIEEDSLGNFIIGSTALSYNGYQVNRLFKIKSTGLIDSTFYTDTLFVTTISDILLQQNGKILVAGQFAFNSGNYTQVGRLLANGNLDTSFHFTTSDPNFGNTESIGLFADGNILTGGGFKEYDGVVKRGLVALENDIPYSGCQFFNGGISAVSDIFCGDSSLTVAHAAFGTSPYSYSWDNSNFTIDDTIFKTNQSGIHYLSVKDSIGCSYVTGFLVNGPSSYSGIDNSVDLIAWPFRPGFASHVNIIGMNQGCVPSNGSMMLIIDTMLTFTSAVPPPNQILGDTLIWDFTNQMYNSQDILSNVHFITNPLAQIGDSVHIRTLISPISGDTDTTNNHYSYAFPIVNGYDPNDKKVYPEGECIPHYIEQVEKLKYTIRFQNTGNSEAINIYLNDTISEYLDINSVHILSSSHEMFTLVQPGNLVQFVFNDISLPDSSSNPDGSIGFVLFEISQLPNLFDETRIENKAEIYFDFNPAIITNEVFNTIRFGPYSNSVINLALTSCDSILWNGSYYSNPGIYTFVGQNIYGCDSTTTLNLTIHNSNSGIESISACDSYTWAANGTTYLADGVYTTVLSNVNGCDSIATLDLTINTVDNSISILDDISLEATTSAAQYQWLDCDDSFSPIVNETNQLFVASMNGNYAVEISENGCVDTSACFVIDNVSINEINTSLIHVYPNPTFDLVTIQLGLNTVHTIEIMDTWGRNVKTVNVASSEVIVDLQHLERGVYYLKFIADNSTVLEKVVKE